MPGVNYVTYGCSSARTTSGVITIPEHNTEENIVAVAVITQDRVIDGSLKRQIENQTLCANINFSIY